VLWPKTRCNAFGPNNSRQNDMLPFFPKSVAEKNSLKRQVKKGLSSIVALGMGAGVGSKQVRGITFNSLFYQPILIKHGQAAW
jgi:hypothetical protein